MTITTNSSAETLALETQLEKLESRAEAIDDDINDARAEIDAARAAFINDGTAKSRMMEAERDLSALKGAADALKIQIAAVETSLEKSHAADVRQRKSRDALELALQVETERRAAFERAAVTLETIANDLPATVAHIKTAALTSKRLSNLLASDNPPKFTGEELRRMQDLATEDVISVKAQIYMQASENAALIQFRDILERAINGFSVAPPAPSAAPADLSDINLMAGIDVQMREILVAHKMGQVDTILAEQKSG